MTPRSWRLLHGPVSGPFMVTECAPHSPGLAQRRVPARGRTLIVLLLTVLVLSAFLPGILGADEHMAAPHSCVTLAVCPNHSASIALAGGRRVIVDLVASLYEIPRRLVDPPPRSSARAAIL
jgi:hypothetical protein